MPRPTKRPPTLTELHTSAHSSSSLGRVATEIIMLLTTGDHLEKNKRGLLPDFMDEKDGIFEEFTSLREKYRKYMEIVSEQERVEGAMVRALDEYDRAKLLELASSQHSSPSRKSHLLEYHPSHFDVLEEWMTELAIQFNNRAKVLTAICILGLSITFTTIFTAIRGDLNFLSSALLCFTMALPLLAFHQHKYVTELRISQLLICSPSDIAWVIWAIQGALAVVIGVGVYIMVASLWTLASLSEQYEDDRIEKLSGVFFFVFSSLGAVAFVGVFVPSILLQLRRCWTHRKIK
ncbi:hypothetical protein JAAARDRAFT_59270 [Jaapia argillacea MUCL 33604]|uniref:Uncharacterized protein n=1 Tax=Jaapia argillacea MUCL 33604 TaxID=933084 RepID=A0A067PNL7_9AGAM|nr:hypothetical protein JAAARDRAFT_59270 [Jaapia argillacea MUCL 33604]